MRLWWYPKMSWLIHVVNSAPGALWNKMVVGYCISGETENNEMILIDVLNYDCSYIYEKNEKSDTIQCRFSWTSILIYKYNI